MSSNRITSHFLFRKPSIDRVALDSLRGRLTDLSTYLGLIAGFPIVLMRTYQCVFDQYDLVSWISITVYAIVSISAILRRSIGYRVRAVVTISLMFFTAFFGLSGMGYTQAALVASFASSILALSILGFSEGVVISLITCVTGISASLLLGKMNPASGVGQLSFVELVVEWWPELTTFLAFYLTLAVSIVLFESLILQSRRDLERQSEDLRKLNEELLRSRDKERESNSAKSQFMAIMSHELKTPLNPVFGLLNLLKSEPQSDESLEYIAMMENSSRELLTIINNILDYVELDHARLSEDTLRFRIRDLCDEVIEEFKPLARSKGLELSCKYGLADTVTAELEVETNPRRLKQLLGNLLSNAIKYTDKGFVRLTVSRERGKESGCNLVFAIQDTGIGIPDSVQTQIYHPFKQGFDANTRKYGGIGLGLSFSLKILRMLNGRIHLKSKEGEGSTFTLELPCVFPH